MADARDCPSLRARATTSVVEVIDRLTEIRDWTGTADPEGGIARFSELYLTITQGIWGHIQAGGFFADDAYLARLDVAFANRYFDALRAWAGGRRTPRAWQVLFEVPDDGEITAIQLAGAGVNAHINFDLAAATVETGRDMGDADLDSRWHDYAKVNDVFAERMDRLLQDMLESRAAEGSDSGPLSALGRLLAEIVATARHSAWKDARALWPLLRHSEAWGLKEQQMDAMAYLVSRGLLVDLPG